MPTFLIDVDNTLLDNDLAKQRIADRIRRLAGPAVGKVFWELYETVRKETGVVDFPLTIERLGITLMDRSAAEKVGGVLWEFDYASCVYPEAPAVLRHLDEVGTTVVLSDGDAVFQPHKIKVAGVTEMVDAVVVTPDKVKVLGEVRENYPSAPYVAIDDKPEVLERIKAELGGDSTTVFVRQGKHAWPWDGADLTVGGIGELITYGT